MGEHRLAGAGDGRSIRRLAVCCANTRGHTGPMQSRERTAWLRKQRHREPASGSGSDVDQPDDARHERVDVAEVHGLTAASTAMPWRVGRWLLLGSLLPLAVGVFLLAAPVTNSGVQQCGSPLIFSITGRTNERLPSAPDESSGDQLSKLRTQTPCSELVDQRMRVGNVGDRCVLRAGVGRRRARPHRRSGAFAALPAVRGVASRASRRCAGRGLGPTGGTARRHRREPARRRILRCRGLGGLVGRRRVRAVDRGGCRQHVGRACRHQRARLVGRVAFGSGGARRGRWTAGIG